MEPVSPRRESPGLVCSARVWSTGCVRSSPGPVCAWPLRGHVPEAGGTSPHTLLRTHLHASGAFLNSATHVVAIWYPNNGKGPPVEVDSDLGIPGPLAASHSVHTQAAGVAAEGGSG